MLTLIFAEPWPGYEDHHLSGFSLHLLDLGNTLENQKVFESGDQNIFLFKVFERFLRIIFIMLTDGRKAFSLSCSVTT